MIGILWQSVVNCCFARVDLRREAHLGRILTCSFLGAEHLRDTMTPLEDLTVEQLRKLVVIFEGEPGGAFDADIRRDAAQDHGRYAAPSEF